MGSKKLLLAAASVLALSLAAPAWANGNHGGGDKLSADDGSRAAGDDVTNVNTGDSDDEKVDIDHSFNDKAADDNDGVGIDNSGNKTAEVNGTSSSDDDFLDADELELKIDVLQASAKDDGVAAGRDVIQLTTESELKAVNINKEVQVIGGDTKTANAGSADAGSEAEGSAKASSDTDQDNNQSAYASNKSKADEDPNVSNTGYADVNADGNADSDAEGTATATNSGPQSNSSTSTHTVRAGAATATNTSTQTVMGAVTHLATDSFGNVTNSASGGINSLQLTYGFNNVTRTR